MALLAEQHLQIANTYEKAAADPFVPRQHREAFARKADWFRLLAQIESKKRPADLAALSSKPTILKRA
jgi:hypothetical protein